MLSFNQVVSNQLDWEEDMKFYDEYLSKIDDQGHRMVLETVLNWVSDNYPNLGGKIAWNQPMFTDHGTFIIAFSIAKNNFAFTSDGQIYFIYIFNNTKIGLTKNINPTNNYLSKKFSITLFILNIKIDHITN